MGARPAHVDADFAVEARIGIGGQGAPAGERRIPGRAARRERPAVQELEGGVVGRDQAGAGAGLDAHVADGHALFHRQGADGAAAVLDDVPGAAADTDLADDGEYEVFGADARGEARLRR